MHVLKDRQSATARKFFKNSAQVWNCLPVFLSRIQIVIHTGSRKIVFACLNFWIVLIACLQNKRIPTNSVYINVDYKTNFCMDADLFVKLASAFRWNVNGLLTVYSSIIKVSLVFPSVVNSNNVVGCLLFGIVWKVSIQSWQSIETNLN